MTGETDSLGARVRAVRVARRMTQGQLAERAHISRNHVHRIETGSRRNISPTILRDLAEALGVPLEELAGPVMLAPLPEPWLMDLSERLDALPDELQPRIQALIGELIAAFETPMLLAAAHLNDLLGETAELSEAELQAVAEYALHLLQQQADAADATGAAPVAGPQSQAG